LVDDVLFMDFDISGYVSPALDLSYFLAASTTGDLRKTYLRNKKLKEIMDHINAIEAGDSLEGL
jgi:hypothetical protein